MTISITKRDVIWSYAGYALTYSINVLMLPFVLRMLPTRELGLWYTFLAINQFIMLLDFGFMPTVLRNASFCWSGVSSLTREGLPHAMNANTTGPNYALLHVVLHASQRIYGWIGLAAAIILLGIGYPYVRHLAPDVPATTLAVAWLIFAIGALVNIACGYWPALLRGIGAIAESNKVLIGSRGIQFIVTVAGLWMGGGLVAVTVGFLACGLTARLLSWYSFWGYGQLRTHLPAGHQRVESALVAEATAVIWHSARRQGLASLGNGLIQRSGTLVCSSVLGLAATASYGLAQQMFAMVTACAAILFNAYLPVLNAAGARGDLATTRRYLVRGVLAAWFVLAVGTATIVFAVPQLLPLLGTDTRLVSPRQCAFMGVILSLEINHLLAYTFLTTRNHIPAPYAFLTTGVSIIGLSVVFTTYTSLGLWGILIAYFVAQLAHNNWRWPAAALRTCALGPVAFLRIGISTLGAALHRKPALVHHTVEFTE